MSSSAPAIARSSAVSTRPETKAGSPVAPATIESRFDLVTANIQVGSLLGFVFVESLSGIYTLSVVHGIPYIAIVQGYALILRQLYGPAIAGWRLGVVMLFAMAGMAVGGWMGGAIFDATLSYRPAFQLALAFNMLNLMLLGLLFFRQRPRRTALILP